METIVASNTGSVDLLSELCPDCKRMARHIAAVLIENRLLVNTFRCPNGHRFSKQVNLKYTENANNIKIE